MCLLVTVAAGEVAAQPLGDEGDGEDFFGLSLEELVEVEITTQRRTEKESRVPISVTAITRRTLDRFGINNMERLALFAPGLIFGRSGSDARPAIRGVPTRHISGTGDPVNGFVVDGIYQPRTPNGLLPFVDLERVEVQKGPQGTLFGRNTLGGNISLVTRAPRQRTETEVQALMGDFAHQRLRGHVNTPLGATAALRGAFLLEAHDGYVENLDPGGTELLDEAQRYLRGALRFVPTAEIQADLRVHAWKQEGAGGGLWGHTILGTLRDPVSGERSIDGNIDRENPRVPLDVDGDGANDRQSNPHDPYQVRADRRFHRDVSQQLWSLELNWDLGLASIRSLSAYNDLRVVRDADSDFTELDQSYERMDNRSRTFTQELHVASIEPHDDDLPFEWLVGGFFLHERLEDAWTWDDTQQQGISYGDSTDNENLSLAGFGQISCLFVEAIRVTVGGRFTYDTSSVDILRSPDWSGNSTFESKSAEFPVFTWNVGVDYTLDEWLMFYSTARTGHKTGGFNASDVFPVFEPERAMAYELGSKAELFGKRVFVALAGYWNAYTDFQVQDFDVVTRQTYFSNAGEASVVGAELEVEARMVRALWIKVTTSLMRARYDKLTNAPSIFERETRAGIDVIDLSGKEIILSPALTSSLMVSYELDLGAGGRLIPALSVGFVGDYFTTQYNTALDRQEVYTSTDLRVLWEDPTQHIFAELYVQNIEDNAVLQTSAWGGSNALFANYGAPRRIGAMVGARLF